MPARTAQQVIARLQAQPPALYHRGRRIADVTTEPGIKNGVHSLADLYDHQWTHVTGRSTPRPLAATRSPLRFRSRQPWPN
ncbi:MAG: hypothetical protein R3E79_38025 [Caldilineaceae bacterium]